MNWFRVYHDIIDDPKVLGISPENRWNLIALYSVSSRQPDRGQLPPLETIAIHLRFTKAKTLKFINEMVKQGFVDASDDGKSFSIHGWHRRQFKSDDVSERSQAAMARVRERSREQPVNGEVNVGVNESVYPCARVDADPRSVSVSVSVFDPEGGAGGNTQPPPAIPQPGPEFDRLGELAIEMSCDLSLGTWVGNMARLGHTAAAIRHVLEQGAANGKWDHRWLQAILKRVAVDGIPEIKKANVPAPKGTQSPRPEYWKESTKLHKALV